ncbi:unnamed protein product [Miscanthus lutarioriparius]|uniref:Transmembrane 9 superfamily member n=1 Tax=Miscanthus lutarioriparius TaxID=422564 RepID=A0A811SKH9_9POAL|nr:unnamed protein product [Miscanthus lutarioriparius]
MVLFLSVMVAMIMLRTLYRDISKYNQLESQEEAQEESGWKLLHGDVFRPPVNVDLLCVYVGTGYSSARFYKMFGGMEWKKVAIRTVLVFPGVVFLIFFALNMLLWGVKSSGAVPFTTMFALVFLWFGISMPLIFIGSYLGFKKPYIEDPVRTNKIPRPIPQHSHGILPFGAVFMELLFILTIIWMHQFYYIFGFLFLVFVILIVTCAEITIVLCYFQLCSEDYQWWWRSYLTPGSSALYLFLYATFYFFTEMQITKAASGVLYLGYMLIASLRLLCAHGTIGFLRLLLVHQAYILFGED